MRLTTRIKQKISFTAAIGWQNLPLQPAFSIYENKNLFLYFYWRGKDRPMEREGHGRSSGNSSGWASAKLKLGRSKDSGLEQRKNYDAIEQQKKKNHLL